MAFQLATNWPQLDREIDEFYGTLVQEGRFDHVGRFLGYDSPNCWIIRGSGLRRRRPG